MMVLSLMIVGVLCASASAGSIPIVVDQILPDMRPAAPVKFGVPFPQGALKVEDAAKVRIIDDSGAAVPHQAAVTATWNPDGSAGVRWLLVDMLVDRARSYTLQFNEAGAPVAPSPDIARVADGLIHIDTGPVQGAVRTDRLDPFTDLSVMGAPMGVTHPPDTQDPLAFNGFYVEHETKGIFRADLGKSPTVVLEETGPIRATIKADGAYANAAGEEFCRYSVRMHFFKGRPDVKIEHTFIFTGLSLEDRIRSVSMQVYRTAPGSADVAKMRGFVGNDNLREGVVAQDFSGGWILQDTTERDRFDLLQGAGAGPPLKVAERGGGWLAVIGGMTHMSVAIRDAWQQFPWEFEISNGAVRTHLWPKHGRLLDTSWDGQWWMLTERQKRNLAAGKPHKETDLDAWIARLRKTNATGAAKTHEVWMSFMGPAYGRYKTVTPSGYAALGREVAFPTIAHADVAWQCATRALDWAPHTPYNTERFSDEENFLDAMLYTLQQCTELNHWYGWWDWGGYHQHLWPGPQVPSFGSWADNAGRQPWHRARPKSHYGWGGVPWIEYFRTGRRHWLRYGQTYTLYSCDRAHAHYTGNGRQNGAEYHYDNSEVVGGGGYQNNPSGDQPASNLQGKDDYVYQYWLTGDRRALDVLKNSGEQLLTTKNWGVWKSGFDRGNDIRNAGMQLHRIMMLYQATWDPRYLELGKTIASSFYPIVNQAEMIRAEANGDGSLFHAASGWAYEGMWFYWNVTHDAQFEKAFKIFIERNRDYDAGFPGTYGLMRTAAYGYLMTGDEQYLNLGRASLDGVMAEGMTPWQFLPSGKMRLKTIPLFLGVMASAPEKWRHANLPTHERGRALTWRYVSFTDNPYYAGADAVFQEKEDKTWSIDAAFSQGGRVAILRPDGQTAVEATVGMADKLVTLEVPSDGMTGTYILRCLEPSEYTKQNKNSESIPMARVIRRDLPMMVQAKPDQAYPVTARAQFFRVPAQSPDASVHVGGFDWRRPIWLRVGDEPWRNMTAGDAIPLQGPAFRYVIPPADADRVLGLRWGVAPDVYSDARRSQPGVSIQNLPTFIAGNPEDLFTP